MINEQFSPRNYTINKDKNVKNMTSLGQLPKNQIGERWVMLVGNEDQQPVLPFR